MPGPMRIREVQPIVSREIADQAVPDLDPPRGLAAVRRHAKISGNHPYLVVVQRSMGNCLQHRPIVPLPILVAGLGRQIR